MSRRRRPPITSSRWNTVRRSRAVHDVALHAIGRAIIEERYPTGSLLPTKEQLMAELGVSHSTLREALQTLAAKGMVAAKARVGTRVLDVSHWNMFDAEILSWQLEAGMPIALLASLFEIRQSLEPAAAALAAIRRSEDDLADLKSLVTVLDIDRDDRAAFVEADVAFHRRILEASGNPFMRSLAATISTALSASFNLSAPSSRSSHASRVQRQHADVVAAIAARDPERASDAMTILIHHAWATLSGAPPADMARIAVASFRPS